MNPLEVCNKISRMVMGLIARMKKCVDFVQIWIKRVSMKGNVVGIFLGEGMCWRFSTAIGFCNNDEHVGPRWMLVYFNLYILLSPYLLSAF